MTKNRPEIPGVSVWTPDLEHDRKIVSPKKAKQFAVILGYSQEQFIALAIQDSLEHDGIHLLVQLKAA